MYLCTVVSITLQYRTAVISMEGKSTEPPESTMEAPDNEVSFDSSCGQEAQEWLSTVYAAMEKLPAGKLFALLKAGTTVMTGRSQIQYCLLEGAASSQGAYTLYVLQVQLVNQAKSFIQEVCMPAVLARNCVQAVSCTCIACQLKATAVPTC